MKAVFDTNILIDYLNGIEQARVELAKYDRPIISIITQIEVMVGVKTLAEKKLVQRFLSRFQVRDLDEAVAEQTIHLRKELKLKIPDAIVYATAGVEECLLVTRNTKDFSSERVNVRVPYQL